MKNKEITKRKDDYSAWYLDIIEAAELAEHAPVKGCMVIKPYGYALWENFQKVLDAKFKETGVKNAYFPLFIPQSFLTKEAEHVEGFAPECAVVTHAGGKKLEEPLVVRPTSETIMYDVFSRWIQSYRDLPLLINQWANVVRWELRPRLFLRTTEFLWQEGHTVHASEEEAEAKSKEMLEVYRTFAQDYLAISAVPGKKSESEKFAGAVSTYTIEAMMQDGKALQSGTSHMLGQNFSKPFEVKFLDEKGNSQYGWQTSWGVSTRMIGALIMAHSDDKGLVLPPKIAPIHAVIIPVWVGEEEEKLVFTKAEELAGELRKKGLIIEIDKRDTRPGPKFFEWEKKGVPVRIEIGPKDLANKSVMVVRRDSGAKQAIKEKGAADEVIKILDDIQAGLLKSNIEFREKNTVEIDIWDDFKKLFKEENKFILAHWCGSAECEAKIKEETKVTIRCLPFGQKQESGKCILCGKPSGSRVIFDKAY